MHAAIRASNNQPFVPKMEDLAPLFYRLVLQHHCRPTAFLKPPINFPHERKGNGIAMEDFTV